MPSLHRTARAVPRRRRPGEGRRVDASEVLRAVRRRQGWSQRVLAERTGIALSTVAAVEAGRRQPSLEVLNRVLAAGGLELAVDVPVLEVPPATAAHLHRSLEQRLHLAAGGDGHPRPRRPLPAWTQLQSLAVGGGVHLHGHTALAMWLAAQPVGPLEVCAPATPGRNGAHPDLDVRPACGRHVRSPVSVRVGHRRVRVDPPADLALDPEGASHRQALRAVARLLHAQAARDDAGRRTRAHADPEHERERLEVFHTKRFRQVPLPPADDTRSWRLEDDASLRAWLHRHGHPV